MPGQVSRQYISFIPLLSLWLVMIMNLKICQSTELCDDTINNYEDDL